VVLKKNFPKVLDEAAKAGQNLASLLLMSDAKARISNAVEKISCRVSWK